MNTPETGQAIHSAMNPSAPVTVAADYTSSSVISPETGLAIYINTVVGPEIGQAVYTLSQEMLSIAVPYGQADYTDYSVISPETGLANYS